MKTIDLNLSTLKEGAIQEQFELEMEKKVLENIHDLSTEPNKKRQVVITLDFTTNDNRDVITMNHQIKSKLAPQVSIGTTLLTGRDIETGQIEARELKSGIPNQAYIDVETGEVLDDAGKPLAVKETPEMSKVIDLQAKKA